MLSFVNNATPMSVDICSHEQILTVTTLSTRVKTLLAVRVYVTVQCLSVRLSVCLSCRPTVAATGSWFAA